ncbi:phosphate ABC transporter substrate-binding protein PstS [Gluconobacter morbifer]|uniref:Phosphate-binding protein PstS n=1 Tax=Gluconobacter morbifer G707 TaxID=1088869 RepID=G6XK70_9PROT|nr:phosphate ABC transporter substrate-binding protein PstS [Gluconobacter morbifer]EHH68032.1 phosphate-binding periplasmic protein precursor [Gluconobacter morbifer G707]
MTMSRLALFGFLMMGILLPAAPQAARAQDITGAGSSFAAPIYGAWGLGAKAATGIAVNYQTVGSGAGQDQVMARTVDFGASDKPLTGSRLEAEHLYQFPTVMSGIVVVANVPGLAPGQLRLDGPVLAALYDGSITSWNDPRIQALNPGLTLADAEVAPVHRADGSGTTFVFTSYLAQVSPDWKRRFGAGTAVAWTGGAGARGNDGIAAMVKQTTGGLGYVEYSYAAQNHLDIVQLKNRSGAFVRPSLSGFAAAAQAADWQKADHYGISLLDMNGPASWPIVTATFVLVPTDTHDATTARAVHDFFAWGFAHGDADNARLDYVGLPETVKNDILTHWPR